MKKYMIGLAAAMMAASYAHPEDLFDSKRKPVAPITPKVLSKEIWVEHLKSKGLQEFKINGKCIIAHNEREAQKRYNKRYK